MPEPDQVAEFVSQSLTNFMCALKSKDDDQRKKELEKSISELRSKGIILRENERVWAALIKPSEATRHHGTAWIDSVRLQFSGWTRLKNRVFLTDSSLILPSEQWSCPAGDWEFWGDDLTFAPVNTDLVIISCEKFSASAELAAHISFFGEPVGLGAKDRWDDFDFEPGWRLHKSLPKDEHQEWLGSEIDSIYNAMAAFAKEKTGGESTFKQAVWKENMSAASNILDALVGDALNTILEEWTQKGWTFTRQTKRRHWIFSQEQKATLGTAPDDDAGSPASSAGENTPSPSTICGLPSFEPEGNA